MRQLVLKFPLVLNWHPEGLRAIIDALRQLAYTRDLWQQDFETITPSLLAFYIRDHCDQLRRLEFLVASGESPDWRLRDVFKPSNHLFARKHRSFGKWVSLVKRRAAAQEAAPSGRGRL